MSNNVIKNHLTLKGDKYLWLVILVLSITSILAVYSATRSLEWKLDKQSGFYLFKQIGELSLGLCVIFFVHKMNYAKFARWTRILFIVSIILLFYTLLFGVKLNQGARWVMIPGLSKTIQSSDLAKLSIFLYLSLQLSKKQKIITDFKKGFLPLLLPIILICGLIAPENLSTALLIGIACTMLLFIGRVSVKHIGVIIASGLVVIFLVFVGSKLTGKGRAATWEKRIENFIHGTGDEDDNFQVLQASIAVANGKLFGLGPGNSEVKDVLPHPYSDFIFAIIVEEYGTVGAAFLIFAYLTFLWRSIIIFRKCPYAFGAFLALGLSFTLVFQALVNMAVNVQLLPVTGLTLPLVSMGGSSIIFTSFAIGLIMSVSRYVEEIEGKSSNELAKQVAIIDNK